MTRPIEPRSLKVGIDESLAKWGPEIKYVFRTLLQISGFGYEFSWVHTATHPRQLDIYYGPRPDITASVKITSCGKSFSAAPDMQPMKVCEVDGNHFLSFGETNGHPACYSSGGTLNFANDIVFSSYWLLSGAREKHYQRDKWDNFRLDGSAFLDHSLASKPLVSHYGQLIRQFFKRLGCEPLQLPWTTRQTSAAFVLSHDVDYPQIIRTIECLRLLKTHGLKSLTPIKRVLNGTSHFWKFSDWIEFEKRLGIRSAFYFMARKGSLLQYALGTPDGFYDIKTREFSQLFEYLKDEGCEVGLHASYNAYHNVDQLRNEKARLEDAAKTGIEGNRHHYWRLDPTAPHDTLMKHEQVGLVYDSSLAFEFYPGFRRGICHPFRVYHPVERREINLVELPPAWMDDHFDRRLTENKIEDPESYARQLLATARATNGMVLLDYHPRGMNADFYPRYGPWLVKFLEHHLDSSLARFRPSEIANSYIQYEQLLASRSQDLTETQAPVSISTIEQTHRLTSKPGRVMLLEKTKEQAWDTFAESHPNGNIYHTIAWKKVTEAAFGHKPFYLGSLNDDAEFDAVLPLFLIKGFWGRRLVSVPMRDRGGLISDDAESASRVVNRAIELTRELRCKYLELRSLEEMDEEVAKQHNLTQVQHWITTQIDLRPGTEVLWKSLDKDAVRWAIKKGRRTGLTFSIEESKDAIENFYTLFSRTRHEMGIPAFPKDLFLAIWRQLILKQQANLCFVWKDAQPIHAMINLFSKDSFIPAYAAPQNSWRKDYPSEFMIWNTIEWATQNGFKTYDFGADSPRQIGLLKFKKKWGGVQHPVFSYFFLNGLKNPPSFDSSSTSYSLLRKLWKNLPPPVSQYAGSRITRQLS